MKILLKVVLGITLFSEITKAQITEPGVPEEEPYVPDVPKLFGDDGKINPIWAERRRRTKESDLKWELEKQKHLGPDGKVDREWLLQRRKQMTQKAYKQHPEWAAEREKRRQAYRQFKLEKQKHTDENGVVDPVWLAKVTQQRKQKAKKRRLEKRKLREQKKVQAQTEATTGQQKDEGVPKQAEP